MGSGKNMSFNSILRALFSIYCFKNQGFICHRRLLAQSSILQSLTLKPNENSPLKEFRTPPHNLAIEQAVFGCVNDCGRIF